MRVLSIVLTVIVVLAQTAGANSGREVVLTLPHALGEDETAWVELELGALTHGEELSISTTFGRLLGTISPYGVRSAQDGGTYSVPLPRDVITGSSVSLRLTLGDGRAPTSNEVKSLRVKIVSAVH
jgi:hypothetical protein